MPVLEKTLARPRLAVDYPRQDETIEASEYALRISAPEGARAVEVCIDQGDWRPCRPAVGYWWHDWSGYEDGEHEAIARADLGDGKKATCEPHEFFVRRRG